MTSKLLLLLALCSAATPNPTQDPFYDQAEAVLRHLNSNPNKILDYVKGNVVNAQQKANIVELSMDVEVVCLKKYPNMPCSDNTLNCRGFVSYNPDLKEHTVMNDVFCVPKKKLNDNLEEEPYVLPVLVQPQFELSHETAAFDSSADPYLAVPKDTAPCVGCPFTLDVNAEGVDELVETALDHIGSERGTRHVALKILQLQSQVVDGVKYFLLVELSPTLCKYSESNKNCPLDQNQAPLVCFIEYFEKPWVSRAKHIISNNCTKSQEFVAKKRNDMDNEIEGLKPISQMSPSRLADLEAQIIPEEALEEQDVKDLNVEPLNSGFYRGEIAEFENVPEGPDYGYGFEPTIDYYDPFYYSTYGFMGDQPSSGASGITDPAASTSTASETEVSEAKSSLNSEVTEATKTATNQEETKSSEEEKKSQESVEKSTKSSEEDVKDVTKRETKGEESSSSSSSSEEDNENGHDDNNIKKEDHKKTKKVKEELRTKPEDQESSSSSSSEEQDNNKQKRALRTRRGIPGGLEAKDPSSPKIKQLAEETLLQLNSQLGGETKHELVEIKEAASQVVAGVRYVIKMKLKNPDGTFKDCDVSIWDRPWIPKKITKMNCTTDEKFTFETGKAKRALLGGEEEVDVNSDKIQGFVQTALDHLNGLNSGLEKAEVMSASRQVVAGILYRIKVKFSKTDCEECAKLCELKVVEQLWLHKRDIEIQCDGEDKKYSFGVMRAKRELKIKGAPTVLSNDDPKAIGLVKEALGHVDGYSQAENKLKLVEIVSATKQSVSGTLYKIEAKINLSKCKKEDEDSECEELEGSEAKICKFEIWDQPWIKQGKKIDVDCDTWIPAKKLSFRVRRSVKSSYDPKVFEFINTGLDYLDMEKGGVKHGWRKILDVSKQVVSGVFWRIKLAVTLTDCPQRFNAAFCEDVGEDKVCEIQVWEKAWLENGREFVMLCEGEKERRFKAQTGRKIEALGEWNQEQIKRKFEGFMISFNKTYRSTIEKKYRMKVFSDNLKVIDVLNKYEQGTAKYGLTRFADMTQEEFSKGLGYRQDLRNGNDLPLVEAKIPDVDLPVEFDWRKKGVVSEVKNQGQCGSCWAFSVTGNIEGQYAIKHGNLVEFSEQELLDCDSEDQGCNGGLMDTAYKVIEKLGGLESEQDYPYEAEDLKCAFNKGKVRAELSGAVNISQDETDMAKWLTKNGPISIAINANAMQFYMGGVSHPWKMLCNPKNLDHGVLIVGYGVHKYPLFKKSLPFWIVKNSWGSSWGEQGYYRVFRGDGTCGVNQTPSSAIVL